MQALLAAAGFDHEVPRAAHAAHLSVRVTEELVSALLPQLFTAQAQVEAQFKTVTTGAEAKAKCLFCARGCGRALQLIVEVFIACSAARARTEGGDILMDTEPIYKRFYAKNRLFQLPFFSSQVFLDFAGLVAAAEERERSGAVEPDAAEAAGLGMSPIAARIDAVISRRLSPLDAKMQTILGAISQAGPATAAQAVMPLPSLEPKRKRNTIEESAAAQAAKRGPGGIPTYVLAPNKETVARLWEEYTTGLNGGPAVRNLIELHGRKWRPPGDASRQLWRKHSYVYEEIERRMKAGESEVAALAGVQARLDAHAKPKRPGRGKPAGLANWEGLVKELQAAHPRRVEDGEGVEDEETDE